MTNAEPIDDKARALIDPRELPPGFMLDIVREHRYFAVLLFRVMRESKPEYIGSGTLVTVDGEHMILTAEHVWVELRRGPKIGLSHTSERNLDIIRTDLFDHFVLEARASEEWGPDLALIRVPDHIVPKLKGEKAFHDLSKVLNRYESEALHPIPGFWFWFFLGAPAELAVLGDNEVLLKILGYFSAGPELHEVHQLKEHDYYDLRVNRREIKGLPTSHGGMSGGGLWRIEVLRNEDGSFHWPGVKRFEGVVFYQQNPKDEVGFVRAHGRKSIKALVKAFCESRMRPASPNTEEARLG